MSADSKTVGPSTETVRVIAELRGLGRVHALSPDLVAAAFERGRRPIGAFPKDFSATTEPAGRFTVKAGTSE